MRRYAVALGLGAAVLPGCVAAFGPVDNSPRPQARGGGVETAALDRSVRPQDRADRMSAAQPARPSGFENWIREFRSRALAEGISADTFDHAFRDVRFNESVIEQDRNQSEFTRAIWQYLDSAVSDTRVRNGRAALRRHGDLLADIEARYGVEAEVVVAIWGLESSYGSFRGNTPLIEALATLAHDGRRGAFFEQQLIAALRIVQSGDVAPSEMTGSWAGAMGHTQFIPTSYLEHAVDFRGTGRRDIWSDDPTDALASAASYLARHGWTEGQPWGVEVTLPRGFDHGAASGAQPVGRWQSMGVRRAGGGALPDHGQAELFLPAGHAGPAFLTFGNFNVIKRYNNANSYAMAVGRLAHRLAGGGPIRGEWPREDRPLTFDERSELQQRLTRKGFDTRGVDGRIGPNTLAAVRRYQAAQGLIPDGYVSLALLERLR